ncbi:FAD binding domain-containing protein [Paraphoma chrysanthemicola]|uniref:FAD binding domain-containing protein n=1 Tax=Paraphoma chrysanthemicola TaxID=798071 RepID=A0A8K0R0M9_9PLEO|nr:FAD binding domain-containing protein [Paraphoma chrysanthemicola]
MPREPYQRCSQAIFEAWLKPHIMAQPLITTHFGVKFESLVETENNVISILRTNSGELLTVTSKFVIGCDGAGSAVRKSIGIGLTGGPVPSMMHLIHFKSRDLTRLQKQGQFWHIFFTHGACLISQDEKDTWTIHIPRPIGTDVSSIDPMAAIYEGLGTKEQPYHIDIDEVLVTSGWRPNICIADRYISDKGHVFLSGDAAHQNIPTGGYGMNTAVGDSFDIGWKLAAAVAGYAGPSLLKSYETERRPVAVKNIDRSGRHWMVHATYQQWCDENPQLIYQKTDSAKQLKQKIADHVLTHDEENTDHGIEMGYRYHDSSVIIPDPDAIEKLGGKNGYVPETVPGGRAPHVFLSDGNTSIYDLFGAGQEFTLVDFTTEGLYIHKFESVAKTLNVPLKLVHLPDEEHVHRVWERDAILVRPDDHVAWRATQEPKVIDAEHIFKMVLGTGELQKAKSEVSTGSSAFVSEKTFTGTVGNVDQNNLVGLAVFQT